MALAPIFKLAISSISAGSSSKSKIVMFSRGARAGPRDHDRALLDEKPQADLPGGLAVVHADQPQLCIVAGAASAICRR
jgi:hypothetical protein